WPFLQLPLLSLACGREVVPELGLDCFKSPESGNPSSDGLRSVRNLEGPVPAFSKMPNRQPDQVAENDTPDITLGRLTTGCSKLLHFCYAQPRQGKRTFRQPPPRKAACRTADKDRIDDGRTGTVDMD